MTEPRNNSFVHPWVHFIDPFTIGSFVLIGEPFPGASPDELLVEFGGNAFIRSHSVIYGGNRIGRNFITGHGVLIRECNTIGDDVSIGSKSSVEHHVVIGNRVRIHSNVFIPEYSILKDDCWIGPHVVLTNAKYPNSPDAKKNLSGPVVGEAAVIGANATILPGVRIGRKVLVAAGAVVTRDVPEEMVVAGNPAKVLKSRNLLPYENPSC